MREIASFNTDNFKPVLPDEYQPNPGVIGFELCWHIVQELAKKNIYTDYPQQEDWSWYIIYGNNENDVFNLYVSSPFEEEPKWRLILEPVSHGVFKKKSPPEGAETDFVNALKEIFSDKNNFSDVVWSI